MTWTSINNYRQNISYSKIGYAEYVKLRKDSLQTSTGAGETPHWHHHTLMSVNSAHSRESERNMKLEHVQYVVKKNKS